MNCLQRACRVGCDRLLGGDCLSVHRINYSCSRVSQSAARLSHTPLCSSRGGVITLKIALFATNRRNDRTAVTTVAGMGVFLQEGTAHIQPPVPLGRARCSTAGTKGLHTCLEEPKPRIWGNPIHKQKNHLFFLKFNIFK